MGNPEGKAKMRTWVAGNKHSGFTLLELLVVVTIIAVASAGVALSLPDSAQDQLEREGQRLAALLDAARAQSRASGVPVRWTPSQQGFAFEGLPSKNLPDRWLMPDVLVESGTSVLLGPEPIIGKQDIALRLAHQPGAILHVVTDGLSPFAIQAQAAAPAVVNAR